MKLLKQTDYVTCYTFADMQLTLPILLGIALADSINPVSFGILTRILEMNRSNPLNARSQIKAYISSFVLTYFVIGVSLYFLLSFLSQFSQSIISFIGAMVMLMGMLELNRVMDSPVKLGSLSKLPDERIDQLIAETKTPDKLEANFLAITTAVKELVYSGGYYFALIGLLTLHKTLSASFTILVFYCLVIALPLVLLSLDPTDFKLNQEFDIWKQTQRRPLLIGIASLQIILGVWLLFWWFV